MVLEALGRDPARSLHTRGVAEAARISPSAASLVLRALEGSGLVLVEDKGNMRFYRLDLTSPVAREWKVLFNVMSLKPLTEDLSDIAEQVVLFGSAAEGTDSTESDFDLFILTRFEPQVRLVLRRFEKRSGRHLSPIIVNAEGYARLRRRDRALYENISKGRMLWERG